MFRSSVGREPSLQTLKDAISGKVLCTHTLFSQMSAAIRFVRLTHTSVSLTIVTIFCWMNDKLHLYRSPSALSENAQQ